MKRFHLHLHVSNLEQNIAFYSAMFNQPPARSESDYAKWMLTDPPVNFAISTRGGKPGIDHLGIQVDSADELDALKTRATAADMLMQDVGETTCCYARSDKYWLTDPQGVAWEQFHTLDSIPLFNEAISAPNQASAPVCCAQTATESVAPVAFVSVPATTRNGCGPGASAGQACC